jgi:hypothetical protein
MSGEQLADVAGQPTNRLGSSLAGFRMGVSKACRGARARRLDMRIWGWRPVWMCPQRWQV